jgi:hypothetical protein
MEVASENPDWHGVRVWRSRVGAMDGTGWGRILPVPGQTGWNWALSRKGIRSRFGA